ADPLLPPGPSGSLEDALGIVEGTPGVLAGLLAAVPGHWWEAGAGDAWSARTVVEHLLDVEEIAFVTRIRRIVEEDDPFITSIDPSARLEASRDPRRPVPELVDELARRRADDAAWVRSLAPGRLDRTGTHDTAGTISGRQLVHYWATHDLVHLAQLLTAVRSSLEPHIGTMGVFLEGA
ncbi:MAG: DinB family protein, partial [Actinomycetota bacterium]